jgi:predicted nucleotidyltransferase
MKSLGLIVEYNPFHKGHLHHLEKSIEKINPSHIVAVMSGNFVQRGEPALINKFARTEMALENGIDLVLELPFVYSIQDAGGFANGSVGTLSRLKKIDNLVFGSESNNLELLDEIAELLYTKPAYFNSKLKGYLKEGISYPNARKKALLDILKKQEAKEIIESSNDILGIEYLLHLKKYNSSIIPNTIKRVGSKYNEKNLETEISSATAIRESIFENGLSNLNNFVPEKTLKILGSEITSKRGPIKIKDIEQIVFYNIYSKTREQLEQYHGVIEGMSKRFLDASKSTKNIYDFIDKVKTKRFTRTRIKRTLLNIVFDIKKEDIKMVNKYGPQYIRVLGFNKKGQEFLSEIKKDIEIPIFTTVSKYESIKKRIDENLLSNEKYKVNSEVMDYSFKKDVLASNIYTSFYKFDSKKYLESMDYENQVIRK